MSNSLVALQAQAPDVMNSFNAGQKQALGVQREKREAAQQALESVGAVALGAMGGDINGQADPQKFEQGLDMLEGMGMDVGRFRGRPDAAPVAARASMSALQQLKMVQDDKQLEFLMQKFDADLAQWGQEMDFKREELASKRGSGESPLGKLKADFNAGLLSEEEYRLAVAKATQSNNGITIGPDGTVTIGGKGDAAYDTQGAKNDANTIKEARDAAATAQELRSLAVQMEKVLPNVGYTGFGGEFSGKIDDIVGFLPGEKGSRGAFKQMSMDSQLAMTQKTKGAITDREMAMFKEAVPGLTQSGPGNKAMIGIMKAAATRQEQRASFFEQYRAKNRTLNGATEAWGKYLEENPLISNEGGGIQLLEPKKSPAEYIGMAPTGPASEITSKEQYDALPSGSEFVWQGKRGKKP